MPPLDIPEVLIILGFLGCFGLAIYNWAQRHADASKRH